MFDTATRRSVGELFKLHGRQLLTYLKGRAGPNDAPDLLQETFVRALRHDGDIATMADPQAFLQVIATNLARDLARRRNTEAKYLEFGDLPDVPSQEAPPADHIEESERSRVFRATIETLPPRCREVFILVMQDNLSVKDAANRLGMSDSMARRHIRLAFRRCREAAK
jgi:RNA polymerase sigma factor (sigma-70 family)